MVGTGPDSTCMKCHTHDDKPRQVASDISDLLRTARERAAEARAAVDVATTEGLRVPGAEYALEQVTTAELKIRGVVHTLDPARVQAMVADIDDSVTETLKLVANAEHARKLERRGYYLALAFSVTESSMSATMACTRAGWSVCTTPGDLQLGHGERPPPGITAPGTRSPSVVATSTAPRRPARARCATIRDVARHLPHLPSWVWHFMHGSRAPCRPCWRSRETSWLL